MSRGLSNDQRGMLVRLSLADPASELVGPQACSLCRGLFSELGKFAKLSAKASEGYEFSTFLVGTKVDAEIIEKEEQLWTDCRVKGD